MSATDPPRPWCGLPDELKVKILEYTLETNEAEEDIINDRRSLFSIFLLEPLPLTSKRMNELALETWGKSKLMIWVPSINMRMQYINPKFGRYIRNLSLSVSVPDHLAWHDPDLDTESVSGMLLPYELRGYRETPWRVLLSCKSDRQSPLSEWQAALPNLSELEVHLKIQNRRPGQTWPWRVMEGHTHKQDIEGFLAKASCNLCADRVSVRVHNTGFVDDNGDWSRVECPDGCNERLAVGVKALIEQNKL